MGQTGLTSAEEKRLMQRKAWTAANMRSVGTKLTLKDHERLLKYCEELRLSRYFLLQSLILEQLDAYDAALGSASRRSSRREPVQNAA